MVRLGTSGILIGSLAALVVFPLLTFATPVTVFEGVNVEHVGLSASVTPADDRQWFIASNGRVALPGERLAQNQPGDLFALPSLVSFAQVEALNDKAELRNPSPQGGMLRFLLIIIVLGALVRYLTSPAYYRFICDVLDPRNY